MKQNNRYKILVIDDDVGFRYPIESILREFGFTVEADSEEDGLERKGPNCDLWVIDVRLPTNAHEGLLAVDSLLKKGVRPKHPIIFMSVDNQSLAKTKLEALSAQGIVFVWLEKPIEPEYLLRVVLQHLSTAA